MSRDEQARAGLIALARREGWTVVADIADGVSPFNTVFFRRLPSGFRELIYVNIIAGRVTRAEYMVPVTAAPEHKFVRWHRDKLACVQLALKGELVDPR